GSGARFYNQGPFGAATPNQGYQLMLTPPEVYRVGILATNRYCETKYGKRFAQLEAERQDEILKALQSIELEKVPGSTFFGQLLSDTKDGFFSDPVYGGNRDMVGWKLVGFPGAAANYTTMIGKNESYSVAPVDIGTVQRAEVPVDEHGHPVHQQAMAGPERRSTPPHLPADRNPTGAPST